MHHPARVRVRDRLAHLEEVAHEPTPVGRRVRPVGQEGGQRVPVDELHGEVRPPVGEPAQVVDRYDPRVLELAAQLGLLDEPLHDPRTVREVGAEHLERQVAAEVAIPTSEDHAHPAAGQLPEELVALVRGPPNPRGRRPPGRRVGGG